MPAPGYGHTHEERASRAASVTKGLDEGDECSIAVSTKRSTKLVKPALTAALPAPRSAKSKWLDYVALLVMLRRLRLSAFPQTVALLVRNIIFFAARCKRGCASINTEAQLCLKKFSFHEPLRDIDQRHL